MEAFAFSEEELFELYENFEEFDSENGIFFTKDSYVAQMYSEDSDLDTKVRNGWSWIWSETWRFRPELSTTN